MKLQYCSDLHLEFEGNKNFLKKIPLKKTCDILILAGDIVPFAIMDRENDFFNFCSDNYKQTYWIPGNHEYYYASFRNGRLNDNIRSNVKLLNNQVIELEGVKLVFTTLWSHISPKNQWFIQKRLSDFQAIKYNGEIFTPHHYNLLHESSLNFITSATARKFKGKTIVVTHHVPTFLNYPEKFKGDTLNEAFASEQFEFISKSKIDFWIYGHHHANTPAFKIGETTMLTNQLGYVQSDEHKSFNSDAVIEI
ncbi:MAG: metallophosphoesterase [Bacteroidetes bacterium RIFCSPLOWO2_12_FULL_35_15]|nr:MAG: metallophosphoesterase [Bacteroidetes bacterium RIFCSPLOWO2_12_FULL_35_15]